MAGRNHLPPNAILRELPFPPHPALMDRASRPFPPSARPHPAIIEEHLVAQHREIQGLLLDNQRLAATHVALKQDLSVAQQELHHISATAAKVKAERDAEVRQLYERSLKMEAEVRSMDALNAELAHVKADIQKLSASRQELKSQLQEINGDLTRVRGDLHQVPAIKAEIESMHRELQRGRAAVDYEKKAHAGNLEQSQAMEKNMISMAQEVEKLHAELANAEKRARAAAAAAAAANPNPGYAGGYGAPTPDMVHQYGGTTYANPYSMHQVQSGGDAGIPYGSGAVSHGSYDMQQPHVYR